MSFLPSWVPRSGWLSATLVGIWPWSARAQFVPYPPRGLPADLEGAILTIVQTALLLVGVLALAYLVYGGFQFITSRGEEQTIHTAKETIANAVVGIVVIGLAYAIVTFVFQAFGK